MRPCSSAPVSRRTEAPTSYEPQRTRASTPSASTPRSAAGGHPKSGQDLADTIKRIESRFHLGLRIRDETWSPAKSDGSLGDRVQGSIKTLYWSAYPTLNRVVDDFQHKLDTFPRLASRERLDLFHQLLRQETPKRRDTPSRPAAGNRPIYIPIPARDQAPKTLRSSLSNQLAEASQRAREPESVYVTASQTRPGTPTDNDDSDTDYEAPPSPIVSSHAAQRRVQASQPSSPPSTIRQGNGSGQKRHSDSSSSQTSPSKFSRTLSGRQSNTFNDEPIPSPFVKPTRDMARSYQRGVANRSFDTNNTSFTSVFSEATQPDTANTSFAHPDTANTSFMTEYNDVKAGEVAYPGIGDVVYPDLSRSSSSAIVSIEDDELVHAVFGYDGANHSMAQPRTHTPRHVETPPSQVPHIFTDVSPNMQPSVQAPVKDTSPKMPYQLRDLPNQGLFMEDFPRSMMEAPFIVRLECALIAATNGLSPATVLNPYTQAASTYEGFWEAISKGNVSRSKPLNIKRRSTPKAWAAAKDRFQGWTLKGSLQFNTHTSGQLFSLQLEPLQWDNSCRLQRKFGSDRFLYLTVPAFDYSAVPHQFKPYVSLIEKQWELWLTKDHSFVGRKWRAFHLEDVKKKKSPRNSRKDDGAKKRVVLFATEGCDITSITIGEMLNWFFPFAHNTKQSFCKAFARLDLALSRTTPTISLKPSQVHYILDTVADGSREDDRYNDRKLDWSEPYDEPHSVVMNDGCSVISMGAARLIWKALRQPGAVPSAFQGRFGGAKGMWMVSAVNTNDVWIQITESQLKFNPYPVDKDPTDRWYDPLRLTFEVNGYSTYPTAADLHMAFIPILVDRGVSVQAMSKLINERLDFKREELIDTLADPTRIRSWVNKQTMRKEETFRDTESPARGWLGGLPRPLGEKIIILLESGFIPSTSQGLSDFFCRFVEGQYKWMEKSLSVPLGRATNLYGLADPLGVLEPGEIHVQFSQNFEDEHLGERYSNLDDLDLLVARQPACRRSDVQKVRAVFKQELAHLTDVVIFPLRGQYPLAGKLQGGDYDGDRFWLCWEPALVSPFRNAPAPLHSPKPVDYGIQVERRKLSEIMDVHNLNTVGDWLSESFKFRNNPALLGIVTNFLESQMYHQGKLHSPGLEALCAMHDLLVDSAKQGFVFTKKDFEQFVNSRKDIHSKPRKPAYKEAMEKDVKRNAKPGNPLDYLYFKVMRPHNKRTIEILKEELAKNSAERKPDPVLQERYVTERDDDDGDPQILGELNTLKQKLNDLYKFWSSRFRGGDGDLDLDRYDETIEQSYDRYRSILPSDASANHPVIKRWLRREHGRFTGWDLLRASVLAHEFLKKDKFMLYMAGAEFSYLKSGEDPYARTATWRMYATLKPRKAPKIRNVDGASEEDDGYETAPEASQ